MKKKLFSFVLILVFMFTPIFLTGCGDSGEYVPNDNDDDLYENTTEPEIDPDSSEDLEDITPSYSSGDYIDGVKVTYKPDFTNLSQYANEAEINDYIGDINNQVMEMSEEIIARIVSEYGLGITAVGYMLPVSGDIIFSGGKYPFDATVETYDNNYVSTHKNAIVEDVYYVDDILNPVDVRYQSWKWDIPYSGSETPNSYISNYLSMYNDYLKMALYMILEGKDIGDLNSDDYTEYMDEITAYDASSGQIQYMIDFREEHAILIDHVGLLESDVIRLERFILNVVIGDYLLPPNNAPNATSNSTYQVGDFVDMDADFYFDAEEFVDANLNGLYDNGEIYNDLNGNSTFDYVDFGGSYETNNNFFKNYVNTVNTIVNTISINTERYPQIKGLQLIDFNYTDIEATDELFRMSTGEQDYKSIIFMNEETIDLKSILLAFESERDFDLQIYARYYKTLDVENPNSGQIIFDSLLTTLDIGAGTYDISENANDFEVDIEGVLQAEGINNCELNAFVNNTPSLNQATMLNSTATYVNDESETIYYKDYFDLELDEDNITVNAKYIDNSTDFVEIVFNAIPKSTDTNQEPILFKIGILGLYIED